jgi:hypothetical protein
MDEQRIRELIREEYQSLASRFGTNQTPVHYHDNIGSPKLSPTSLTNAQVLSPQTGGVLAGGAPTNFTTGQVVVFPIPILSSTPPSGTAPEGTIVIGSHLGTIKLYGMVSGVWRDLTGL